MSAMTKKAAAKPRAKKVVAKPVTIAAIKGMDHNLSCKGGDYGAASNSGYQGAASSHSVGGKVMGEGDGQALYCTEFANNGSIKSVACGVTGRGGIAADTWYTCRGGKLVRA